MEPIKEEPEDFGASTTMLNNIEEHPGSIAAGLMTARDVENQSESETMTSGDTEDQSPTDNMALNELEGYSDLLDADSLSPRDTEQQSEASTVILGDFEEHPGTVGTLVVAVSDSPKPSPSARGSPDHDSDEENHFSLSPETFTTPPGATSSRRRSTTRSTHAAGQSPSSIGSEACMACQEGTGRDFFGYCGPCTFKSGRWRLCDMCSRCLPSVGWRGFCFDCVPMVKSERDYIWAPGTESIKELIGEQRLHRCLRCGNDKVFDKTCEVCWGPQPDEYYGPIIHESTGGLDPD